MRDADGRIDRLRQHCDDGLRYYTWALRRMPSMPQQRELVRETRNARNALAVVLAYVEGAPDARSAGRLAHEEIVPRYDALVDDEGWEPSFGSPVEWPDDGPSQDEGLDVFTVAERQVGTERFGGGWFDTRSRPSSIWVAILEPTQADLDVIAEAAKAAHWPIRFRAVTYSRSALIGFSEHLRPPGDSAIASIGWSPERNRVVATLNRWDESSLHYLRDHIPTDALQIDVVPGLRATALED